MTKMAFQAAAKAQLSDEERAAQREQEPWFEFSLLGHDFIVREKPSPAQSAVLLGGIGDGSVEFYRSVFAYLDNILEDNGGRRIRRMLERNEISFELVWGGDDQNEKGIVDTIIELVSENPTVEPSGSSTSRPATSKRSTGRSPGKGSTLSET
ncbi:tail assembly chaperone [Microbacterium phage Phinky]|nr:tail assembly chaperone [Microbacterium phage Phinky]